MTFTIKSNGKITNARIIPRREGGGEIYSVEIDFEPPDLFSDLEFWLEDESGKYCDHAGMNISKRNKMQFHK